MFLAYSIEKWLMIRLSCCNEKRISTDFLWKRNQLCEFLYTEPLWELRNFILSWGIRYCVRVGFYLFFYTRSFCKTTVLKAIMVYNVMLLMKINKRLYCVKPVLVIPFVYTHFRKQFTSLNLILYHFTCAKRVDFIYFFP